MFTVHVTLDIQPDHLAEFVEAIRANSAASRRREVGCVHFDVSRDAAVPTRFYFYEVYRDRQAFEHDHRSARHYADYRAAETRCMVAGSKVVTFGNLLFSADRVDGSADESDAGVA